MAALPYVRTFLAFTMSALSLHAAGQGLAVTASTYVQANSPTTNYSSSPSIIVKNNATNNINVRLGYLKFDLSAVTTDFPSNFGLNMVTTGNNQGAVPSPPQSFAGATTADPATFIIQVWGLDATTDWDESTVNWNNAPGTPGLINSASQTRYGFNESQSTLLATCSIAANVPESTFYCGSASLLGFMNARKGASAVTLMFRRTDTNSQANLSIASARLAPGGITGAYSPTFAAPNEVGTTFTTGPMGASVGNPPTVTTATPTSTLSGGLLQATLGGNVTDTGGDSPAQFVQYRLTSGGPWTSVDMGLSTGTATSSGGPYSRMLSVLAPSTGYDVQAYATNSRGTAYGAIRAFTTAALPAHAVTVTVSPAQGGTAACTPNPVPSGTSTTCTAVPAAGYSLAGWSGDCSGSSCTLANVTSAAAVSAQFIRTSAETGSGASAVQAQLLSPGTGCSGLDAATFTPAGGTAPNGDPYVLSEFAFTTTCNSATLRLTYPELVEGRTKVWKFYGGTWHDWTSRVTQDFNNRTVTFTVLDNGDGDDAPAAGTISDPIRLSLAPLAAAAPTPIPTLSQWGLLVLSGLLAAGTWLLRRRPG